MVENLPSDRKEILSPCGTSKLWEHFQPVQSDTSAGCHHPEYLH